MPILQYLTTTHFDFGAVKVFGDELARLGVKKPLITTDKVPDVEQWAPLVAWLESRNRTALIGAEVAV